MSKNLNKLLIVLVVFIFGILIFQLLKISNQSKLSSRKPTSFNIQQNNFPTKNPYITERPTPPVTPISVYYSINNKQKPINQLFFEEVKRQLQPDEQLTSEGLYQGKVLQIEKDDNNVYLIMENHLQNGYGKTVWFQISNNDFAKTKVYKIVSKQQQPTAFADIKTNSILDINENVDYSKDYDDRIINLTITIKYAL